MGKTRDHAESTLGPRVCPLRALITSPRRHLPGPRGDGGSWGWGTAASSAVGKLRPAVVPGTLGHTVGWGAAQALLLPGLGLCPPLGHTHTPWNLMPRKAGLLVIAPTPCRDLRHVLAGRATVSCRLLAALPDHGPFYRWDVQGCRPPGCWSSSLGPMRGRGRGDRMVPDGERGRVSCFLTGDGVGESIFRAF